MLSLEMWKVTTQITNKLQTFVNCCLRSIMGIRWPKVIRNTRLWEGNGENPLILQIRLRKWQCIGHAVTMGDDFITGGEHWIGIWRKQANAPKHGARLRGRAGNRVRWTCFTNTPLSEMLLPLTRQQR